MVTNRVLWIDWARALGIMIVVYCHVPQDKNFVESFLHSFQMPLFFMLSGYLHKSPHYPIIELLKKYWRGLIVPYILFQFLFYPYWLIQGYVQNGLAVNDLYESLLMPLVQCLCGIPIDGPTWFLFALLITKLIADIVFRCRFSQYLAALLCLISVVGAWIIWEDDKLNISFAIDSLFDFFPFFFIGYYSKVQGIIKIEDRNKCIIKAGFCFAISVLLIICDNGNYAFHRIAFYILGLSGSFFIINICKAITNHSDFIQVISVGSIIILGLHWMFIGTTNFIFESFFSFEGGIRYTVFEAMVLVLGITLANYVIIRFCQKHFKALLGYR